MNPKNPFSAFLGLLFSALWLAVLAWITPPLVVVASKLDFGNTGTVMSFGITSIVVMISFYWFYGGVIWVVEDWSGKDWESFRPRGLPRPNRD